MKTKITIPYLSAILAAVLTIPCCTHAQNTNNEQSNQQTQTDQPSMYQDKQENELNTAVAEIAGIKYKLMLIGDLLPNLYVDGKKISRQNLDDYAVIIDSLSSVIGEKQRMEWKRKNSVTAKIKQHILEELVIKKYVSKKEDVRSFYLSGQEFRLNEKTQSPEALQYFSAKFLKSDDKAFYYEK